MKPETELMQTESAIGDVNGDGPNGGNGIVDFADLLDEYETLRPKRGQILEGIVLKIEPDAVIVDIGAKRDAIVTHNDLDKLDEALIGELSTGDSVPVYVLRTPVGDEELVVSLNRGLEKQDWDRAEELLESGEIVEAEVTGHNKGGLLVDFGRLTGFVPNSHVPQLRSYLGNHHELVKQKGQIIGSKLMLNVIDVNPKRKRLVLSAKEAEKERRQKRLSELEEGQVVTGTVSHIVDYGAFVELDGVTGLLHISELDWEHVTHPADVLKVGQELELLVQSVDLENERISLSRKALMPNPYERFAESHHEGQLVEGEVTATVDFGAFVQVADQVEGLVHVSEMDLAYKGAPEDVVQRGERVLTRIISIDAEQERLGLSMRRVSPSEEIAWMSDSRVEQALIEEEE
ncbi:MAG: 30S ribosomal protein S1 [Candidatus Promineifilaceae bacterium]